MVTYINKVTSWEHPYMEYRGLSTDTKPADAPVNAKFVELDTGVEYYFSEGTWNIAPSPSGDGSGGGAEKFVVTLTADDSVAETVWTADKTLAEIVEAAEANQVVVASYPDDMLGNLEIPLLTAIDQDETLGAVFCATFTPNQPVISLVIVGIVDGSSDEWNVFQKEIAEVPSYSSSNNGQVLGVDDGDLAWITPSGGAEKFVVTLTESNGAWSADKTIAEIAAADAANQVVVASGDFGQSQGEVPLNIVSSEEGNEYALFSGVLITDKKVGVQIIGLVDGGADEWTVQTGFSELPSYSSSNNGQVLGVDDGELAWVTPESGITSWNDLTDKPFYEEVTPGINLEMPDGASYVEASFTVTGAEPMTIPMKLYRAGGVYTTEQLVGATATLDIGETNPYSKALDSESFFEIKQDGETVGYLVVDEGAYAFIVLADNTVFNTSLDVFDTTVSLTSDNIPTAGTYLINAVIGADETTCTSITKAASTVVHQLDSKYIPTGGAEKFVVTLTDNSGVTSDKTIAEIVAAKAAGKEVVASVTSNFYMGAVDMPLIWSFSNEYGSVVFFSTSAPMTDGSVVETLYTVYGLAQTGQEEEWNSDKATITEGVPSYSSSNNGQVLGVSSGDLAWVDSNAPLIVTLTEDQQTPGTYVGDKTFAEIHAAATAGRTVVFVENIEGDEYVIYCTSSSAVVEGGNTVYQAYYITGGDINRFEGGASDYPSFS